MSIHAICLCVSSHLDAQIRFLIFLHSQKRDRKAPTLGNLNLGAKAHFVRACLSQLPVAVTQAPRQGWIPQIRRCKYPSQHMAVGVETGWAGRGVWEMPGTVDAWCTFSPGGWELKDHSKHKAIWNWCFLQPMLTMRPECLGIICA